LRLRAAWAAGAPRIHGGTGLDSSRPLKPKTAGAIIEMSLSLRRTLFLDGENRPDDYGPVDLKQPF